MVRIFVIELIARVCLPLIAQVCPRIYENGSTGLSTTHHASQKDGDPDTTTSPLPDDNPDLKNAAPSIKSYGTHFQGCKVVCVCAIRSADLLEDLLNSMSSVLVNSPN